MSRSNQFAVVSRGASMSKPNRLRGAAVYLAGPMTACADFGSSWRQGITPMLQQMGVVVFDPTNKPIEIGQEDAVARKDLDTMRAEGDLDGVRDFIKVIRRVDLRCVDLASFIIVRLDGSHTMGTFEEIAQAVDEQKPLLVWLDGTLNLSNVNPWLLAQVPLEYIFENFEDMLAYLHKIDESPQHPTDRRWMLFDFATMYQPAVCGGVSLTTEEAEAIVGAADALAASGEIARHLVERLRKALGPTQPRIRKAA